jgi:superoxide dismutase
VRRAGGHTHSLEKPLLGKAHSIGGKSRKFNIAVEERFSSHDPRFEAEIER